MKRQNGVLVVASLGLLFAATTIHAVDAPQERELPTVMMGAGQTATATVEAINQEARKVILRSESGELIEFLASDEVRNLEQVNVGDVVVVNYQVGLIMALKPSIGGVRERRDAMDVSRAELGQKPGAKIQKTIEVTATVRGVDKKQRTVTLQGPNHTVTLPVSENINLDSINVGDQVDAMYRESLAISVEAAPAPAK